MPESQLARVLVVDDEPDIRELLCEILEDEGYRVSVASDAESARRARVEQTPDLALLDIWMPDIDGITLLKEWHDAGGIGFPVIMMSGHGTIETAVEATRLGAYDFVEKPLSLAKLLLTVRAALGAGSSAHARPSARSDWRTQLVGHSAIIAELRERVAALADGGQPVLLRGEPGSGKHAVARLLHEQGARAGGPWVYVDIGRIGLEAAEEALFGRQGAWAQAAGGTLALDDIAELDDRTQALLAQRIAAPARADTPRLVALSAEDLPRWIAERMFRAELFRTLSTQTIHVAPLREHAEDIPDLLRYFIDRCVDLEGLPYRHFTVAAQNRLRNYHWPGNVGELETLVRRVLSRDDVEEIDVEVIEGTLAELRSQIEVPASAMPLPLDLPLREAREAFERAYLQHQLRLAGGRIGELARRVGMERTHLYRKLRSLGIEHSSKSRS
ncbi:MAG: sigma-54 dependent transcriptional regulator [Halofilum sp. (in: g-proteobacteria)]|nr:sigma-54 dependent transcriptional regulator [Halofilum sp. (in: g-proteobacteria)]